MNIAIPILLGAAASLLAQTQPSFEVASIKPAEKLHGGPMPIMGGRGGPGTNDPGLYTCNGCNVYMLAMQVFEVQPYQMSGVASIMDDQRFNISARIPEGATKEQFRLMQQNFLIDRFGLKFHRETKEVTGYELTVAKGGPKMKVSVEDPNAPPPLQAGIASGNAPALPPPPRPGPDGTMQMPRGRGTIIMMVMGMARMHAEEETMDKFVQFLSNHTGTPVVDATGLKDKYDFEFTWDGATMSGRGLGGMPVGFGPPPGAGGNPLDGPNQPRDPQPTLFSALQSELGLKLDAKKVALNLVVIEHYDKSPTEN